MERLRVATPKIPTAGLLALLFALLVPHGSFLSILLRCSFCASRLAHFHIAPVTRVPTSTSAYPGDCSGLGCMYDVSRAIDTIDIWMDQTSFD